MDKRNTAGVDSVRQEDRERWEKTIQILSQEISEEEFTSWFDGLRLASLKGNEVHLIVSTSYRKDWMSRQYTDFLEEVMSKIWNRRLNVHFLTAEELNELSSRQVIRGRRKGVSEQPFFEKIGFNPYYTFENFVVGANSMMTHAASLAVAESPAHFYNPLFIHGGVGLGKTHLVQAIGHKIHELHPHMQISYLAAETFMKEFVEAIRRSDRLEFTEKYRKVDVLIIDDIHFLAGKEGTQDEFFHTFNSLHNDHKQIVITSDKPPKDIPTLSDRLRSRFAWGLITDIKPPDVETRAAILRRKCEMKGVRLIDEVVMYISDRVSGNIRELEGALLRLVAHQRATKTAISLQSAVQLLADLIPETIQHLTIEGIQRRVAEYFHLKTSELLGRSRSKSIAFPRQVAMFLCKTLTDHSLTEIGTYFGNKDHTTVLYSCRKIETGMATEEDLRHTLERVTGFVKQAASR